MTMRMRVTWMKKRRKNNLFCTYQWEEERDGVQEREKEREWIDRQRERES
jgi:hypothetical protein